MNIGMVELLQGSSASGHISILNLLLPIVRAYFGYNSLLYSFHALTELLVLSIQ